MPRRSTGRRGQLRECSTISNVVSHSSKDCGGGHRPARCSSWIERQFQAQQTDIVARFVLPDLYFAALHVRTFASTSHTSCAAILPSPRGWGSTRATPRAPPDGRNASQAAITESSNTDLFPTRKPAPVRDPARCSIDALETKSDASGSKARYQALRQLDGIEAYGTSAAITETPSSTHTIRPMTSAGRAGRRSNRRCGQHDLVFATSSM